MRSVVIVLVLALATTARAQSVTTGAIAGVVTDAKTGELMPGVTVTASFEERHVVQTAITETDGSYKISDLIPGTYEVTFWFEPSAVVRSGIEVSIDSVTNLDHKYDTTATDVIHIDGTPPPIDTRTPHHGLKIGRQQLTDLPVPGPTFVSALGQTGGSQNDGVGISFSGSTSLENRYIVDGIDITGLTFGDVGTPVPNEFIQEIEVITGGYNAEHGRATGGIVNLITRSGTDTFRGSVFGVLQPGLLAAAAHTTPVQASSIDVTGNRAYTANFGAELGGPIIQGKAWFYVGIAPQLTRTDYTRTTKRLTDRNGDGQPDIDPSNGFYITDQLDSQVRAATSRSMPMLAKLNAAITPENQATLSLIALPSDSRSPGLFGLPTSGRRSSGLTTDTAARWTAKLDDNHLEVEAILAWHRSRLDSGSLDPSLDAEPLQVLRNGNLGTWSALGGESMATAAGCTDGGTADPYQRITNCPMVSRSYAIGGPGGLNHDFEDRRAARVSIVKRGHAAGTHELKAGIDVEDDTKSVARLRSGGATIDNDISGVVTVSRWVQLAGMNDTSPQFDQLCADGSGPGASKFRCAFLGGTVGSPGTQVSGQTIDWATYLRDSWQPARNLTINLGLRYEEQRLRYAEALRGTVDPLTGTKLGTTAMTLRGNFAPRIGVVWDPSSEGRSKVYAHWGRFYEAIPMDINDRSFGGEVSDSRIYTTRTACGPRDPNLGGANGTGCLNNPSPDVEQLLGSSGVLVAPGIQAEYLDELLAGAELAVIPNVVAGIVWQHRRLGRVIEDVSTDGADTYIIANPGEFSADEEHALEAQIAAEMDPVQKAQLMHRLEMFRGIRAFDEPSRDYDSIEVSLARRFAAGLYLQATYTYSHTSGNYPGSVSYDNGQIDPNISSQYDLIELLANRRGLLPQDRPHSLKLDASYAYKVGDTSQIVIGTRIRAISGVPENALGSHYKYGPDESFLLPRGTLGRTELEHGVDVHLAYRRKLAHGMAIDVYGDVFNVYNQQGVFDVDNTYAPSASAGRVNNVNPISGGTYDDLIWAKSIDAGGHETSTPTARNPNFHHPTSRYAPTSAQVGFRLLF